MIESSTATATTMSPPIPTLRVSIRGVKSRAPNPTTTVSPDVITARPAVQERIHRGFPARSPAPSPPGSG